MKNVSVKISKRLSHLKNFRHQGRTLQKDPFKSYIAVQAAINSVPPDFNDKSNTF